MLSRFRVLPARLLLEFHLEDVDEVVHIFLLLLDRLLQCLEVRPDVLDFTLIVLQRLRARLRYRMKSQRTLIASTDHIGRLGTASARKEHEQQDAPS